LVVPDIQVDGMSQRCILQWRMRTEFSGTASRVNIGMLACAYPVCRGILLAAAIPGRSML